MNTNDEEDTADMSTKKSRDIEPDSEDTAEEENLEIDAETEAPKANPYPRRIHLARAIDAWRPFPRLFIILYMYIVYRVIEWYLALSAPTMEQSGLISIVVGAGAAWFGLYLGSSNKGSRS